MVCIKSVFVYLRVALIDSDGTKLNAQMHISKNLLQDPELVQDVKAAHVLLTTKMAQLSGSVAAAIRLNSVFSGHWRFSYLQFPETGPTQLSG